MARRLWSRRHVGGQRRHDEGSPAAALTGRRPGDRRGRRHRLRPGRQRLPWRQRHGDRLPAAQDLESARRRGRWRACCRSATTSTSAAACRRSSTSYDPSWGRLDGDHPSGRRATTSTRRRRTAGHCDCSPPRRAGYFAYFGAAAGDPSKGYYCYDLGRLAPDRAERQLRARRLRGRVAQEQWLRADLAAHPSACTLAYWHQPRFSSGGHGDASSVRRVLERPLRGRRRGRAERPRHATSGSRPRTRPAPPTARTASASSSSARAATTTASSVDRSAPGAQQHDLRRARADAPARATPGRSFRPDRARSPTQATRLSLKARVSARR